MSLGGSLGSNQVSSHIATSQASAVGSDATEPQDANLEASGGGGASFEGAFLAAAAQLDGRKRARVRTNHWPLWNHGDDDAVGHL